MTTQFAVLKNLPAGLTFTSAKLFAVSAPDTVVTGNTFSFSNRTNATSQYVVSIDRSPTALPAGDYTLIAYIETAPRAELNCTFAGTDGETASETPEAAVLNSGGQDAIAAKVATLLAESHGAGSWEGGGAGGTDWTVEQRAKILSALGIGDDETVEPVVITPAAPGETTGYAVVRDSANAPKPGVTVSVILATVKQNAEGNMWFRQARTFTSQANGLLEITHLIPGQAYYMTVGSVQEFIQIPASAGAACALKDIAFT